jgi:DNA-directed RNA polymerase II subunit RPB2
MENKPPEDLSDKLMESMILPPPLTIKEEESSIFPELPVDLYRKQDKLMMKYFAYEKVGNFLPSIYDHWLDNILPKQISKKTVYINRKKRVRFDNITKVPPIYMEARNKYQLFLPKAYNDSVDYSFTLNCDFILQNREKGEWVDREYATVKLGEIPLMVRSKYCYFHNKPDEYLREQNFDPADPEGYFVTGGQERIVILQEKLRFNKFMVFIINNRLAGRMLISTELSSIEIVMYQGRSKAIRIYFEGLGKRNKNKIKGVKDRRYRSINMYALIYLIGIVYQDREISPEEVKEYISNVVENRNNLSKILTYFDQTVGPAVYIEDIVMKISRKMELDTELRESKLKDRIREMMDTLFFPNITTSHNRIMQIVIMFVKYVEVKEGIRNMDDRDSWSLKRLESAGRMMSQLFSTLWKRSIRKFEESIKEGYIDGLSSFVSKYTDEITQTMHDSIHKGNWGIKGISQKSPVTRQLERISLLSALSHVLRIDINSTERKNMDARKVQESQYGFVCSVETPEGSSCGLLKNLSLTAQLSLDMDYTNIIEDLGNRIHKRFRDSHATILTINGMFQGFVNGSKVYPYILRKRRESIYPRFMSVVHNRNYLEIYTDGARVCRPLAIIGENNKLEIENKELWGEPFEILLDEGCVEYIDPYEQEFIYLANSSLDLNYDKALEMAKEKVGKAKKGLDDILNGGEYIRDTLEGTVRLNEDEARNEYEAALSYLNHLKESDRFTHCEIDPQATLGLTASLIPYIGHNPGPRNTYQTSMSKQALTTYNSAHLNRFDGSVKVLAYPQVSLVPTLMERILGKERLARGQNITIAITTAGTLGFTQEDSFIINKSTIELGKLRIIKYFDYKTEIVKNKYITEELRRPPESMTKFSSKVGSNGLPYIGTRMESGDVVIGKVQKNNSTGKETNASVSLKIGVEGIVDKVYVYILKGVTHVKVKLRQYSPSTLGNKFAPPFAQKGTLGLIVPKVDMPVTVGGTVPDILFNPHSISSRMTIGMLILMLAGKAALWSGQTYDSSPFRKADMNSFIKTLKEHGINSNGNTQLISGTTGDMIEGEVFIGPCMIQVLKHLVDDKKQVRGEGAINALTRQAIRGRERGGGVRFGEMERDVGISHGATAFIRERMCTLSDKVDIIICGNCGTLATTDLIQKKYKCEYCKEEGDFYKTSTTRSYLIFFTYLSSIGVKTRLNTSKGNVEHIEEYMGSESEGEEEEEEEEGEEEGEEIDDYNFEQYYSEED